MNLRKIHNDIKRDFIYNNTKDDQLVLDVGCGRGGDIQKWLTQKVKLVACDPDKNSIYDARKRDREHKVKFYIGDIAKTPVQEYDVICYNFSIHYIFASEELFLNTINHIRDRSKIGTKLIGTVPDSEEILLKPDTYKDSLGNEIRKVNVQGDFGDLVSFNIVGSPYYRNGPISEPICYKELLITYMDRAGFELDYWIPFVSFTTGLISDVYSKFIFTRIK